MKKTRGFTLIELLVSVGIATIIIAAGLPMFTSKSAKLRTLQNDLNALVSFIDRARNYAVNNESETANGVKGYVIQIENVGTDKKKFTLYRADREDSSGGFLKPIGYNATPIDSMILSGTKVTNASAFTFYYRSPNGNFVQQGSGLPFREIKIQLTNDPTLHKTIGLKLNGATKVTN